AVDDEAVAANGNARRGMAHAAEARLDRAGGGAAVAGRLVAVIALLAAAQQAVAADRRTHRGRSAAGPAGLYRAGAGAAVAIDVVPVVASFRHRGTGRQ